MTDLTNLKGIGTKSITLLNKLNIKNKYDLLTYYPYKYNEIKFTEISTIKENDNIILEIIVESVPIVRRYGSKNSLSFRGVVNRKLINIVIFNRAFLKSSLSIGKTITVFGKFSQEKIIANEIILEKINNHSIEPVYHLTSGISSKALKKYIMETYTEEEEYLDYIPEYLNESYKFINKKSSIRKMHYPSTLKDVEEAKKKLIYEELFLFMFKINYSKIIHEEIINKKINNISKKEVYKFVDSLPFELTKDQTKAVDKIYADITSTKRMNRMLEGDTGCGKTAVAIIACYINYLTGRNSALMAPTEILANQHFKTISNLLCETNLKIEILTGKTKLSDKNRIYEEISKGNVDILVGTHAILNENINFKNLGLVITDEQHRFGVNDRKSLKNKGISPDILYMSATPIPRTFALTLYGDMDISIIKTKPTGRKDVYTIVKTNQEIDFILNSMLDEIKKGHQVYVVCPMIEESDVLDLTSVNKLKETIDLAYNKKIKTEIIHGKLSEKDKNKIMDDFKSGEIKILISTSIIEVGVDVSNATMMVIFDAERFGLSSLHQLRGRIGRNNLDSTCILVGNKDNIRLKVLSESNDGFYITEQDFLNRGEGDIFGVKQSGELNFKIANIKRDYKILVKAKKDSKEFLEKNIDSDFKNYKIYSKIVRDIRKID